MDETTTPRDRWVTLGLTVSAVSAAISSFSGLRSLAEAAGWSEEMSILLPLTVDAYAATATRVWLSPAPVSGRARRFAKWNALIAIVLSLIGNGVYHLLEAALLQVSWPIVLVVGAIPPIILGLVSHLATLRRQVDEVGASPNRTMATPQFVVPDNLKAASQRRPGDLGGRLVVPSVGLEDGLGHQSSPQSAQSFAAQADQDRSRFRAGTDDELLAAVRDADRAYRSTHAGKGITRDELRRTLRVGGNRATMLLRRVRAEDTQTDIVPRSPIVASNQTPTSEPEAPIAVVKS